MASDSLFTEPGRNHIVSSTRFRKLQEYVNAQFGTILHRILGLLGDVRTLVVTNTLTNLAMLRLMPDTTDTLTVTVSPYSNQLLYPPSLTESQKAVADRELGVFHAGAAGRQSLFVTRDGTLDPRTRVTRTSDVSKDTSSKVSGILENEKTNTLVGEVPYLVRFASLDDPGLVDLTLVIALEGASFTANTVKIIPVPVAGGVTIASLGHSGSQPLYSYRHQEIVAVEDETLGRSAATLISFEPTRMTSVSFRFLSRLYSSVLRCTSIGIARIAVEHVVYAQRSYLGVHLIPPDGATTITQVTTTPTPYSPSVSGIQYYFYQDRMSFDTLSSSFTAIAGPNQYLNIPAQEYYVLVEIPTELNCTPVLRSISFQFA